MKRPPHLLIRASAGTGKTYRLSGQFLTLLFAGVEPERILATTFTRKAASEILDRVLERLVQAIEDDAKRAELAKSIDTVGLEREACQNLLAKLTKSLHTFQVRTIDSFFVHLVNLFALDLELPPNWSICDDRVDKALRSDALQDVFAQESSEKLLLLLRELSKGDAGRSVQQALLDKIKELRPAQLESHRDAWDSFATGSGLTNDELRATLTAIEAAGLPTTAAGKPHKNWGNARDTLLQRARDGEWEDLISSGLGHKYHSKEQTYWKKPFPPDLLEALEPLMRHASHEVLAELRARNLAAHDLIEAFEEAYLARKRQEGAYGFGDLPYVLAPRAASRLPLDERELELWFRLDGRIDHLLLDEFQDTSPVQWRILAPVAEEIVSEHEGARSFFCVGDVKQSIYSFRYAEPRLLAGLKRMLPGLQTEEMDRSYRSSQVVLDAVNLVFSGLPENSAFAGEELQAYRNACGRWLEGFSSHEAANDLKGAALVIEARESENPVSAMVEKTVERADCIWKEKGPRKASIGILLRKRKLIPRLIHLLRARGIDASGEGGSPLTDARSVLCFLSTMHLADFPEDSAAAFHVATSPFGGYVDLAADADGERRREISRGLRRRLADEGLGEFTRSLASQVADDDSWSPWDKARFGQLLEQAFAFEGQFEARPSAFVDHVRTKKVEAPGGSSVRVMTIHASKGLEFDAVILPVLPGKFAILRSTLHTLRPEPELPLEKVTLAVKKGLLPISSELTELYVGHVEQAVEDSLSVLYVAMTRAARRLELIVPWQNPESNVTSPETHHVLRYALAGQGLHEPDEDGVIWEHPKNAPGNSWKDGLKGDDAAPQQGRQPLLRLAPPKGPRSLPRRSPSAEEGGGRHSAADLLRSSRGADVGTLVHAYLESLEWIEDFDPELATSTPPLRGASEKLRSSALAIVERALQGNATRKALSRSECGAPPNSDVRVFPERGFALTMENEEGVSELWTGSIDRLVLACDNGRVVYAEIIDYKTDRVSPDTLAGRVEHYAPQLRRYRQVVAHETGLDPASIAARLLFLGADEVVDID